MRSTFQPAALLSKAFSLKHPPKKKIKQFKWKLKAAQFTDRLLTGNNTHQQNNVSKKTPHHIV